MCDEIIALREGRVVAHGPVADVVTPDVLGSIFGLPMGVMRHPTRDEPIGYIL
jgi:iron complex transport system ATP-binding protein